MINFAYFMLVLLALLSVICIIGLIISLRYAWKEIDEIKDKLTGMESHFGVYFSKKYIRYKEEDE